MSTYCNNTSWGTFVMRTTEKSASIFYDVMFFLTFNLKTEFKNRQVPHFFPAFFLLSGSYCCTQVGWTW